MCRLLANAMLAAMGLALPVLAFGQALPPMPVIAPPPATHAKAHKAVPVWQRHGSSVSVVADGHVGAAVPQAALAPDRARIAGAKVRLTTRPGLTAHAGVKEIRWAPLVPTCAAAVPGAAVNPTCLDAYQAGVQRGEVGAGFAARGVKLDVSVGQAQSEANASRAHSIALPRVLPAADGADVAAPLWFRDSTATNISAHGQLRVAPNTRVNVGASVGRVRFLPGSGLAGDDTLDQTTLSFGIQHGAIRGTLVGHVLEPNLPGGALNQSWRGVDLGISVRLPWRGELNFGAQNLWTSGHAPLLFGPSGSVPSQGRVPYVQYHQDL